MFFISLITGKHVNMCVHLLFDVKHVSTTSTKTIFHNLHFFFQPQFKRHKKKFDEKIIELKNLVRKIYFNLL